jgi:glycosyltransferase involved in cell wall biosynthesis
VKRRVLIIIENACAPFDCRVWKEARALRIADYEVTILCPKWKGHAEAGHELQEGIHIYRHPMPREFGGAFGYLLEYGCALFWEFLYCWWIYFARGFDVIQACNPPDTIFFVALQFKLLFHVSFIFDHHDITPELYFAKYGKKDVLYRTLLRLEKATFISSDVVISTNASYRDIAMGRGARAPKDVFVVRNGPDLRTLTPVPPDPALKHGKPFLVAYVGVMAEQDGVDILLKVAEYLRDRERRDIHFTCVGVGPAFHELTEIVKKNNLQETVNFPGRISDEDLVAVLSTADICVNPDKPCEMNDLSTMIKIMEYMALGKPIVQFDLKEGRVSAQDASLYCDNQNQIEDFAAKILWLVDHPEERKRMGEFGRKRVENELAWDYSVPHLLAAYDAAFLKKGHEPIHDSTLSESSIEAHIEALSDTRLINPGKPDRYKEVDSREATVQHK